MKMDAKAFVADPELIEALKKQYPDLFFDYKGTH